MVDIGDSAESNAAPQTGTRRTIQVLATGVWETWSASGDAVGAIPDFYDISADEPLDVIPITHAGARNHSRPENHPL